MYDDFMSLPVVLLLHALSGSQVGAVLFFRLSCGWTGESTGGGELLLLCDNMKSCSGAWRHLLLPCTNQPIVHRTVGVVNIQHSSAVLFATVKGALGPSLDERHLPPLPPLLRVGVDQSPKERGDFRRHGYGYGLDPCDEIPPRISGAGGRGCAYLVCRNLHILALRSILIWWSFPPLGTPFISVSTNLYSNFTIKR